jgi:hypothetical protein
MKLKNPAVVVDRSEALVELAKQHAALRRMIGECEEIADAVDADEIGPLRLAREAAKLRLAFVEHNAFEEQVLRPILAAGGFTGLDVERVIEHHIGEHRAIHVHLGATATRALREVLVELTEHLDAEERHLLATPA